MFFEKVGMMDELLSLVTPKFRGWSWIRLPNGDKVRNVRVVVDGGVSRLCFDGGFTEAEVREVAIQTLRRKKQRRSDSAKKASVTRKSRVDQMVHVVAKHYTENKLQPSSFCLICGRFVGDPESVKRGVGADCWQKVLRVVETLVRHTASVG